MRDIRSDLSDAMSDPDPVRRAQIQMKRPLPKRFYKDVTTDRAEEGFRILLDGRPVRTPGKKLLAVPAEAIAQGNGGKRNTASTVRREPPDARAVATM